MRLISVFLCVFFSISSCFCVDFLNVESGCPEGFGKVRVWKKTDRRVGHVSLQTVSSYISIWPNSLDSECVRKEGNLVKAPALSISNYEEDLRLEEREEPVWYLVKLDHETVDAHWRGISATFVFHTENQRKIPGMSWFAPGSTGLLTQAAEGEKLENCASAVFLALKIGGVDVSPLEEWQKGTEVFTRLSATLAQIPGQHAEGSVEAQIRSIGQGAALLGAYHNVCKPDDISWLLEKVIRTRLECRLRSLIDEGELVFSGVGTGLAPHLLKEILRRFPKLNYEISGRGIRKTLLEKLGFFTEEEVSTELMISQELLHRIQEEKRKSEQQQCVVS